MDIRTAHALLRFGLGRLGDRPLPTDPQGWLAGQLTPEDPLPGDPTATAANGLATLRDDRIARPLPGQSKSRQLLQAQQAAFCAQAVAAPAPFRERLVWFWANHFTVSYRRGRVAPLAAAFVQEAIRPHVTGRFEDMLLAVMRHPAMLLYLDNAASFGPGSPLGQSRHRGLNENLARECLELHTVSPLAGYTQADVTSFARILTGWSVERDQEPLGFRYRPAAHEPGPQSVLGQTFPAGEAGGIATLRFLAGHPATHRFLATKLVRHFVADDPPPGPVRQVEGVLRDTRGDLGAAALALTRLDEAWQPGTKLRTPMEFVVAAVRSLDLPPDQVPVAPVPVAPVPVALVLGGLGQPLWGAPQPNGWPDCAADWATPEAMLRRIDWASGFAGHVGTRDVAELAAANLGPLLQPATLTALRRAGSRRDAMTLFLTSPDFQRR